MAAADWLFARGHAPDVILAVMLAEFVWLTARAGWPAHTAAFRLLPGAFMIIALRCALTGADWRWAALLLAASFPPHLVDLARTKP